MEVGTEFWVVLGGRWYLDAGQGPAQGWAAVKEPWPRAGPASFRPRPSKQFEKEPFYFVFLFFSDDVIFQPEVPVGDPPPCVNVYRKSN